MKTNTVNVMFFAAVILLAGSCVKETQVSCKSDLTSLSICASTDDDGSKTVLNGGSNVYWVSTDRLIVFTEEDQTPVLFSLPSTYKSAATAEFTTDDWPTEATPEYATSTYGSTSVSCTSEGVISTYVNNSQDIYNTNSYGKNSNASVGKVEFFEDGSYVVGSMKNVTGLLKISFTGDNAIVSVKAEAIGGETLAGVVDVDYQDLVDGKENFWTTTSSKIYSSVTILPGGSIKDDDGSFKYWDNAYYCFTLMPQTYSKGIRFVMTDTDGNVAIRTVGSSKGVKIERNKIKEFSIDIDYGVTFAPPELPDEFELDLSFYNESNVNPLGTFLTDQDADNGETYNYTYNYTYKGAAFSAEMPFTVCRGTTDGSYYSYATHSGGTYGESGRKVFINAKNNGWIKLPAVEGRCLQSVSLTVGNTSKKYWCINDEPNSTTPLASANAQATADALATGVTEFTALSDSKPEAGKAYYIYLTSGQSLNLYDLKVNYTKGLPIKIGFTTTSSNPFEGIGNTYKSKTVDPDEFTYTAGGQTFTFISQGAYYAWSNTQGLWAQAAGYLKVPNISGYKLSKIYMQGGNADGKPWQIYSKEGEGDYVSVGSRIYIAKSDKGEATGADADNCKLEQTWTLADEYSSAKDYYIRSFATNQLLAKFVLTYIPFED